jgi:hypothetical protein
MYASDCPSFENWRLAVVAKICPLFCPKKFLVGDYQTRILTETGTKMDFRFRYRRKSTLIRQKSLTDLKKLIVGRLECRYPEGNEILSRRLHFSNGNLCEQLIFCILHVDLVGLLWSTSYARLEFQLIEA